MRGFSKLSFIMSNPWPAVGFKCNELQKEDSAPPNTGSSLRSTNAIAVPYQIRLSDSGSRMSCILPKEEDTQPGVALVYGMR